MPAWPPLLQRESLVVKKIFVLGQQEPMFSSSCCKVNFIGPSLLPSLTNGGDLHAPISNRLYDLILNVFIGVESSLPETSK